MIHFKLRNYYPNHCPKKLYSVPTCSPQCRLGPSCPGPCSTVPSPCLRPRWRSFSAPNPSRQFPPCRFAFWELRHTYHLWFSMYISIGLLITSTPVYAWKWWNIPLSRNHKQNTTDTVKYFLFARTLFLRKFVRAKRRENKVLVNYSLCKDCRRRCDKSRKLKSHE